MRRPHHSQARLEILEHRRLLADAGNAVLAPDGTLIVTGTSGHDFIVLDGKQVFINGTRFDFDNFRIMRTFVYSLDGDDLVALGEGYAGFTPVTIDVGDGNNTVQLNDNVADVVAGSGDDTIILFGAGNLTSYRDAGGIDTLDLNLFLDVASPLVFDMNMYPDLENLVGVRFSSVIGNSRDNLISFRDISWPVTVWGSDGNDTLAVRRGTFLFYGGAGDDVFIDPLIDPVSTIPLLFEPDTFIGGDGNDTLSYAGRSLGITIDLARGLSGYEGENDLLIGVENAIGGSGDDLIIGDSGSNVLLGGAGNDTVIGNGGKDILIGGDGDDLFLSRDKRRDLIFGGDGDGDDTAIADKKDKLLDVEVVQAKNNGKKKGH